MSSANYDKAVSDICRQIMLAVGFKMDMVISEEVKKQLALLAARDVTGQAGIFMYAVYSFIVDHTKGMSKEQIAQVSEQLYDPVQILGALVNKMIAYWRNSIELSPADLNALITVLENNYGVKAPKTDKFMHDGKEIEKDISLAISYVSISALQEASANEVRNLVESGNFAQLEKMLAGAMGGVVVDDIAALVNPSMANFYFEANNMKVGEWKIITTVTEQGNNETLITLLDKRKNEGLTMKSRAERAKNVLIDKKFQTQMMERVQGIVRDLTGSAGLGAAPKKDNAQPKSKTTKKKSEEQKKKRPKQ